MGAMFIAEMIWYRFSIKCPTMYESWTNEGEPLPPYTDMD